MTIEPPATPEPTSAPEPVAPTTTSPLANMSGEMMVTIGAALVVGVYLIFELITAEYFQPWLTLTAAVFILVIPRVRKDATERIAPVPVLLKASGYVIVVSGVFSALEDIRFEQLDEAMAIVGAIVAYAGYVISFLGARAIKA